MMVTHYFLLAILSFLLNKIVLAAIRNSIISHKLRTLAPRKTPKVPPKLETKSKKLVLGLCETTVC